jgi:CarboxypepD_reg-like domain
MGMVLNLALFFWKRFVLIIALLTFPALAQLKGRVVDSNQTPIPGAKVHWREAQIEVITDGQGQFEFEGVSIRNRQQGRLGFSAAGFAPGFSIQANRLFFQWDKPETVRLSMFKPDGQRILETITTAASGSLPLPKAVGHFYLRAESRNETRWLKVLASGEQKQIHPLAPRGLPQALRKATASARAAAFPTRMTLVTSAAGFASRQLAFEMGDSARIALLPASASLQQRLRWMMGDSLQLKLAWLEIDAENATSLHWAAMDNLDAEAGRSGTAVSPTHWQAKGFTDSKGATLPSWAPGGDWIAYETGREATTLPTSQIFLQPLTGNRVAGPAFPATNPRFATVPAQAGNGRDTLLTWCTSGKGSGWRDTSSRTLGQVWSAGSTTGDTRTLAKGSFNAGLSMDGQYLAAAYPRGVMVNRADNALHSMHVYPKSSGGDDSLQICNGSISQDPNRPARMLFIDFGVLTEPGFPNMVRPSTYAQHQMILLADFSSDKAGRLIDFVDTPFEALAELKSWEDPEWSTHADYAVATTRLDSGDAITQPDVYLIRLSTHEVVKLFSGTNFFMPIAWVHR